MNWRPKDWDNQYTEGQWCPQGADETCHKEAFEAGADAILEALREEGYAGEVNMQDGKWIFIPEETK